MSTIEQITVKILNSVFGAVLFILAMAAFYLPYELRIIPVVQTCLPLVRYICAGILAAAFLCLYIPTLRVFRENWALWAALGFVLVLFFSTRMNGGDMESVLGTHGFCAVFLLLCISVFFRVNPKRYLLMAFFLLLAANIANIYTVYHYYGIGMWEEYGQYRNTFFSLVGNYNGGIEYVMPMAICGFSWASRYGGWLEMINYAAVVASLFMAVKCDSLTQMIAYAAILVFMAAGDFSFLSRKYAAVLRTIFQPLILIAVNLAVFVSVVVLNQTNWVAHLGIDPDFHNRRHIWNMSMDWIRENPVWGSGQETVAQEAAKITGYAHSHCTFLEVAYKTGFVGTVFLLLLLAASTVAVYRCRHHHLAYVLSVLAFLMGLAAIAETYPMEYVILCLGLVYYIALSSNRKDTAAKVVRVNV